MRPTVPGGQLLQQVHPPATPFEAPDCRVVQVNCVAELQSVEGINQILGLVNCLEILAEKGLLKIQT
jgi:hypothetical protein